MLIPFICLTAVIITSNLPAGVAAQAGIKMKANHNKASAANPLNSAVINTSNLPTGAAAQTGIKMKANHNKILIRSYIIMQLSIRQRYPAEAGQAS